MVSLTRHVQLSICMYLQKLHGITVSNPYCTVYTNNFIFKDVKGCQNCSRIQLCSLVKIVRITGAAGEFLPKKCHWYIIETKPGSLFIMQDLNC
jgi:hypothetical protein